MPAAWLLLPDIVCLWPAAAVVSQQSHQQRRAAARQKFHKVNDYGLPL
jgi:hypothetical protein